MAEADPISLRLFDVNRPSGLVDDDDGAAAQLVDDLRSLLAPDPQREDAVSDAIGRAVGPAGRAPRGKTRRPVRDLRRARPDDECRAGPSAEVGPTSCLQADP